MTKLNIKSLKEFQTLTARMAENRMLPILAYMRLCGTTITKTNLQTTCQAQIAGDASDAETLLLDQRITFGFIAESPAEEIEITYNDTHIFLADGRTRTFFQREDPTNFPPPPALPTGEPFILTKEHIGAISIARAFINDSESGGNFQFVHVGAGFISAFHTHFFYVNNKFTGLPAMLLNNEQAEVITANQNTLQFYAAGNHYFFNCPPNILYTFTRQEGASPNIASVFERLQMPGRAFNIGLKDLISFCNIANMVAETPVSVCTMTHTGMFAHLALEDTNYNRGSTRDISVSGTFDPFTFNARIISAPLRAIPYDILECKTVQNCLIITGQKEYFCFMGMAKNV